MSNKIKTPIVDKNGKSTHVWKSADSKPTNGRKIPAAKTNDTRTDPIGNTAAQFNTMAELITKNLDTKNRPGSMHRLVISQPEFVDTFIDPNYAGEHWMSNGVDEFKIYGYGTNSSPFYVHTRSANKETLRAVDETNAELSKLFGVREVAKVAPQPLDSRVDSYGTVFFKNVDGEEIELDVDPKAVSNIDPVFELHSNGTIRGAWAVDDDDPMDYEFTEGDSFKEFRSEGERDDYIKGKIAEGVSESHIFIVDKYDHSSVHYSVANTAPYPDRQWDVAPSGVLILDEENENENLGGVIDEEMANETLADYTSWANGDVYGISYASFDKNGETIDEPETVWGITGSTYAQQMITEGYY